MLVHEWQTKEHKSTVCHQIRHECSEPNMLSVHEWRIKEHELLQELYQAMERVCLKQYPSMDSMSMVSGIEESISF